MLKIINTLGIGVAVSGLILVIYLSIYFLLFIGTKITKKQLLNNKMLKIRYILTSIPFITCGLYTISLTTIINYNTTTKTIIILFSMFLIIYPIYKTTKK